MIEAGAESIAAEVLRGRDERLLAAVHVNKVNTRHRKDRRLLLVTEISAIFCRPRTFGKSMEVAHTFSWFDIQQIKAGDADSLALSFRPASEVTFLHEACTQIAEVIVRQLRLVLLDSEFPQVLVDGLSVPPPSADLLHGLYRLRGKIMAAGRPVPDDLASIYQAFLMSESASLDLAELPVGGFGDAVLESLCAVPVVTSVSIPVGLDIGWEAIGRRISANPYIRSVAIHQMIDDSFAAFANLVSEKCHCGFLSFTSSKIGLKAIKSLAQIYAKQPIAGLSLSNCLDSQHLTTLFGELQKTLNLKSLTLDRVEEVSIKVFFPRLEQFETLTLTRCHIDVPLFLKAASRSRTFAVQTLDLSSNLSNRGLGADFVLAASLQKIVLNDLGMKRETFVVLLACCLESPSMLSVSIENAGLGEAELERAVAQILARPGIQERKLGLRELFWDNNLITVSFTKLLDMLVDLRLLSLSGSISGSDQSLTFVTEFLMRNQTVQDLRLCGTLHRTIIPDQMIKLLLLIKDRNRTIRQLDLSHNQFDQRVFDGLADVLLHNRRIVKLCMEDIGAADPAVLENFLNKIHIRGVKLDIPVPRVDVDEMIRNKTIDSSGIQRLFEISKKLSSGNAAIEISTPVSDVIPMQAKEEADLAIRE
jgi:hypothetical protein